MIEGGGWARTWVEDEQRAAEEGRRGYQNLAGDVSICFPGRRMRRRRPALARFAPGTENPR